MRFVQISFGIFMISGATALGCGGSDNANPPPGTGGKGGSAGSGGAAGTATGGKAGAGTGGSTAGSGTGGAGGTGGMATGGTGGMATGGTGGMATGGGAGMTTDGGAGMTGEGGEGGGNAAECPGTAPDDGDACDQDVNPGPMDDPCVFGDTECSCTGFGMNAEWSCDGGMTTTECPMAAPDDGDTCDPDVNPGFMDDPCVFGDTECTCAGGGGGGMPEWNCTMAAMCPTDAPDDGDMCDGDTDPGAMDGGCQYDTTTCVCAGGGGGGMQQWNCGTCPDMAPEDEDACDSDVNGFCAYESGNCTCTMMDEWNCMN